MNYLHSSLDGLRPLLASINPQVEWRVLNGAGDFSSLDMVITSEVEIYGDAKVFYIAESKDMGPVLARLVEHLARLDTVNSEVLETAVTLLSDNWDSEDDLQRLARMALTLWERERAEYEKHWLKLARWAWLFGFKTVQDFSSDPDAPPVFLYQTMGHEQWSSFARDVLGVLPGQASQLKWIWEIYHHQFGWAEEKLMGVGKSKLVVALGALRHELGRPDRVQASIDALLSDIADPKITFAVLLRKLQAGRGNGTAVHFILQQTYQPELLTAWLKPKEKPLMVHLNALVDDAVIENAATLVFRPDMDSEMTAAVKAKFGALLHWNYRADDVPGVEEGGAE